MEKIKEIVKFMFVLLLGSVVAHILVGFYLHHFYLGG